MYKKLSLKQYGFHLNFNWVGYSNPLLFHPKNFYRDEESNIKGHLYSVGHEEFHI